MSIANLPSDLLGEIFLLLDWDYDYFGWAPYALRHKFTLSHVCAAWRSTALNLPLFWAHIYVKTNSEFGDLSAALARSASVPLDVRIAWDDRKILPDKSGLLIDTLLAYRAQLKRLNIGWVTELPQALTRLIGSGVEFPILEEISAHGVDKLPCKVDVTAPLRSLFLRSQKYAQWDSLFTPGLHRLEFDGCSPYFDSARMQALFRGCPNLRELALHTGHSLNMSLNLSNTPLRHVRVLSLSHMDTSVMVDILRTGFANIVPEISVLVPDYSMTRSSEMRALLAELQRGITVTDLEFTWTHNLYLVDSDQGMCRFISDRTSVARSWNWRELWAELASYNINHTLRVLELSCVNWNEIAGAITAHPLGAQDVELRVELYGSSFDDKYIYSDDTYSDEDADEENDANDVDVDDGEDNNRDESAQDEESESAPKPKRSRKCVQVEMELVPVPLNIPNLQRIVVTNSFFYSGDSENIPRVEFIGKILDAISSDATTIEVCVSGAGLEEEELEPVSVSAYAEQYLNGKWTLCSHCVGRG